MENLTQHWSLMPLTKGLVLRCKLAVTCCQNRIPMCLWVCLASIFLSASCGLAQSLDKDIEPLSWAVCLQIPNEAANMEQLARVADELAQATGLVNKGQIGELKDHYLFTGHWGALDRESQSRMREAVEALLAQHNSVLWYTEQRHLRRSKRSVTFNDPKYPHQWHLNNARRPGMDINVTGVWERNVTGRGVTVVVVDDGVEHTLADIHPNYSPEGSYDLNSNDDDPMPHPDTDNDNHHGTRCAGEIAAVPNNSFCAVGVAYGSRIAGIRVLDGPLTDSMEATAFNKHYQINDIYSCSWGPDDDGKTVDGPHHLGKIALQQGVIAGRRGFGSIFVVASGNGGQYKDNCNYDGYANSIYTVTIGAVDEEGNMPFYAEECASMLAVTFSSGDKLMRSIVTSDWDLQKGTGCTEGHTGTSAAAPIAAGMIALMLQVRPCLTWRDVQHIIVFTATKYEDRHAIWERNGAGFSHSHQHGFGLLNAWRMVNAAKIWESVPYLASYTSPTLMEEQSIGQNLDLVWNGEKSMAKGTVKQWHLTLYGSSWTLNEVQARQRLVEHAMSGQYLDNSFSLPCPPGLEISEQETYRITSNTLKTLLLLGCFTIFWSVYYMLEVFLTRKNLDLDLTCRRSGCGWAKGRGDYRLADSGTDLESGIDMEVLPLCMDKDSLHTENLEHALSSTGFSGSSNQEECTNGGEACLPASGSHGPIPTSSPLNTHSDFRDC
ncbi:proprotein convertase subtilisin/kexin type 7 isoform X2 [Pleurodeles waltl]|uniref:proprotein convertase subtilisin/kexin type 7 isoform X2 n=1 Tax=Pleurodeles waltl TaxID=8319 RepID=UPI003709641F